MGYILQAAPGDRGRFFDGQEGGTALGSGCRDISPAPILKRVGRIEEVGTRKAAGVGEDGDGKRWGSIGPGEVVMEGEAVGGLVPGGGGEL